MSRNGNLPTRIAATAGLLMCLGKGASAQIFNCYEGQGVIENAWGDSSWCSDNFGDTTYVYQGTSSIKVQYTAAWQGFSLSSANPFPAGYFSALTLYINGGTTAKRAINVALTVNGAVTNSVDLNKYIAGGSVGANVWRKVSIPLTAFGLQSTDQISRFWLQESSGSAQPAFWIGFIGWTAKAAPASVSVGINTTKSLRTVDQTLFGVNTAVWDNGFNTKTCEGLISAAGYKTFRFPGGSLSDGYNWVNNTTDGNTWTWSTNFDAFASVAVPQTGGQCFITANYGTGTAQEAAGWVKYSNISHKYGFKYWEVGNECYGGWEEDTHARPNDPEIYAQQFALYYKAMKAVDPTIKVGAVSSPGEDTYANYSDEVVTNPVTHAQHSGWTPVMLTYMAKAGVTPDFLIYHRYPEFVNECDFTLLVGNTTWLSDMADLRTQLKDYLGSKNSSTELMCTENNCDAGNEGKQMCSLVNGVYFADSFGTVLQTECKSFLWWDLINGQSTTGDEGAWLYGWRMYGDEGTISPDFTQTYPVYYMEQMVNHFAAAGDEVLPTTSSYGLLTAFSTKRADGSVRVMLVNKNPTETLPTIVKLSGMTPASTVTTFFYGMPQDNAAKAGKPQVVAQSAATYRSGSMTVSAPPYSVTVLVLKPS